MLPYYFLDMTLLFEILFYSEEALCIKAQRSADNTARVKQ